MFPECPSLQRTTSSHLEALRDEGETQEQLQHCTDGLVSSARVQDMQQLIMKADIY
jgi:hypothetical protein